MCIFKESHTLWAYADGEARDPSVLSCNKSSHIEARGGYPRHKGLGYSVVGNGFHLRQWDSHRHAEVNAESLSEYEHDQRLRASGIVTL